MASFSFKDIGPSGGIPKHVRPALKACIDSFLQRASKDCDFEMSRGEGTAPDCCIASIKHYVKANAEMLRAFQLMIVDDREHFARCACVCSCKNSWFAYVTKNHVRLSIRHSKGQCWFEKSRENTAGAGI